MSSFRRQQAASGSGDGGGDQRRRDENPPRQQEEQPVVRGRGTGGRPPVQPEREEAVPLLQRPRPGRERQEPEPRTDRSGSRPNRPRSRHGSPSPTHSGGSGESAVLPGGKNISPSERFKAERARLAAGGGPRHRRDLSPGRPARPDFATREPSYYTREPVHIAGETLLTRGNFGTFTTTGPFEENMTTRPEKYARVKTGTGAGSIPVKLLANYVKMSSRWDSFVILYDVAFAPDEIVSFHRRRMVKQFMDELLISEEAYSYNKQAGLIVNCKTANRLGDAMEKTFEREMTRGVRVTLKKVRVIDAHDPEILMVLNNFKNRWIEQDLQLACLNRCHYDPAKKINIADGNIRVTLWPGFATAIGFHDSGIMLSIDNRFKVIREMTMDDVIREIHGRRQASIEVIRNEVADTIVGMIVITQYSDKPRTYKIMDVNWNETPATSMFTTREGKEMSVATYFKEKYNKVPRNPQQPVLLAEESGAARFKIAGQVRRTVLIPEFCNPTGLTDAMRENFRFMKTMSDHTLQAPKDRCAKLYEFMGRLLDNPKVDGFLKSWDIQFDPDLTSIDARQLRSASLQQGTRKFTYDSKTADWTKDVRSSRFHELPRITPNKILFLHGRVFTRQAQGFWNALQEVAMPMGIKFANPEVVEFDSDRDIDTILRKRVKRDHDLVIVILPNKLKNRYDDIKHFLCRETPVISQVIVQKTLDKPPMLRSVATKICIQMGAKLGGAPWALDHMKYNAIANIMYVGVDTYHDSDKKLGNRSAVAMVATMEGNGTTFSNRVFFQEGRQEISGAIGHHFALLLEEYKVIGKTGRYPSIIIFYRDGVGAGQLEAVYQNELQAVLGEMRKKNPECKMAFMVINKRHNTRFLVDGGGENISNPMPGTVVDKVVTKPNRMDFYIVAQTVRQGTVAPTYYNVIHDETPYEIDQLQALTYGQCCMYYNWSGTVKVPAPCQYAHKLAFLIGQSIHEKPSQELDQFLFFL